MLGALRTKGRVPGSEAGEDRPWRALEAMDKGPRSPGGFQASATWCWDRGKPGDCGKPEKDYSFPELSSDITHLWNSSFSDPLASARSHKAMCSFPLEHLSQCSITLIELLN